MRVKKMGMTVVVFCFCMCMLAGCAGKKIGKEAPYEASVDKVFMCGSRDGELLVVNLNVKNISKDYINASSVTYDITAKLDGDSLKTGYLSEENPNYLSYDEKIAAGEEGKVQAVFELGNLTPENTDKEDTEDTAGKVELLGVTYAQGGEGQVEFLKETINLSEVETIKSESLYELSIDNVVKTDDGEGKDIVIIDMTFTNNSEEATSFGSAINMEIFQNSVALKSGYLPYKHPSRDDELESNRFLDIQKGATLKVREVYQLNDPAKPIEVKATDYESYDQAPILEKEIQF